VKARMTSRAQPRSATRLMALSRRALAIVLVIVAWLVLAPSVDAIAATKSLAGWANSDLEGAVSRPLTTTGAT
jgi:hypothetical protein